ncbi:DNA cytosine methyltransferase [Bradyrhizobium sp. CCBAU 21360]|uniref:DNA cytosine methyltransferase n=1 Tax=Bradyrhizobium sp. CCBAU 21360 TaxID=1325081 RepID=UPI002305C8CF|nr:DNA cytosine methyltransferase [Bradyrhizobium sp. CCBAU 21360]
MAVDLFCGAGGLTYGLAKAGIDVRLGVDIDPACEYPYTANNRAEFLLQSVTGISADDVARRIKGRGFSLLAGCAPCQPFSTYHQKAGENDNRWSLLDHFGRLAVEVSPDFITMENVPNLAKQKVFRSFVTKLARSGFHVSHEVVDCSDFGVPQQRRRLVLLASKLGPIKLLQPTRRSKKTVRQAIGRLPRLTAGGVNSQDPLHQACELSNLNLARILASRPGGTWRDWDRSLVADCHKRKTGKTYPGVYGRMTWNEPAPTMTTQYYAFGSGRFGHPSQARAISLREGAILQSFPRSYKFVARGKPIFRKVIGRLIGNAVPVKLGEVIGKSIIAHVQAHATATKAT